ncbi:ABC transporter permease subunit [Shinella sp. AETb1-6]|uniref:Sugar ABC transporter permease n=1 Tax=Shinella sumterensis TaxID=1967501 RepID=A0AA50HIU6_9HYPH|nr:MULTISPECIES: sugar ABC transporter permease [Shinella]MDP9588197.1 multiple sugar transport system permease protein [Shinella zoogloeoides]MCD1262583.1 ABC transporter permease subunit [Shinella sumterensis]MXN50799.1 ABC transporter permease subunit [Shinella sp. AETb1-6]TFF00090.1 sugar ABC transporter permease [Shinella sumterensis]UPA27602.1 sugar ABC transporter permease [Shinella oryzae]
MSLSNTSPLQRHWVFAWRSERLLPYLLLAPAVVVTLVIVFMPMVQAVWTSFYDLILFKPNASKFVGFGNYVKLFNDPVFWTALWNTLLWIGLTVPLQMGLGLLAALLLNREFPWRGLARALIIIPWALPSVVIALMWRWIYDPNTGVLNDILVYLSIVQTAVPWLADPDVAIYAIIATLTWQGFPFFAVMILAGLQGIPKSQYEAASIDGASAWRQFIHITLPGIAPVLATAGLLRVIWVANSMDVIFVMTGGGPGYATHTLPLYAFIKARQNLDFGYGTSIAVTFTILLGAFVVLYLARTMREVER